MTKEYSNNSQTEQVQDRILQYIKDNGLEYNSVLPKESELAQQLGVSRVVIREAISGLKTLGFIETKRRKGTIFVQPKVFGMLKYVIMSGLLDTDSVKDLYELRLMLEIGMADLVVANRNEEQLNILEGIVEKEESSADPAELRDLDIQFHSELYKMAGNRSLEHFQHMLQKLFLLYESKPIGWLKSETMTHRNLIYLLRKGDVELFRSAMRIHLEPQFVNKQKNISSKKA